MSAACAVRLLALTAVAVGCREPASWTFTFDDRSVAESAVLVEARVHQGACDGAVILSPSDLSSMQTSLPDPRPIEVIFL
jgi:hypothetical protein